MARVARVVTARSTVAIRCAVSSAASRSALRLSENPVVGLRRQADHFGYDELEDSGLPSYHQAVAVAHYPMLPLMAKSHS